LNGCPDADGDGIADKDDACPNTKGTKEHKGCPDTDGDRVIDKNDACPTVAGPAANKGCPWPDTDNDGVLDKDDACVNQAGPASNNGCPQISAAEVAELKTLFTGVYFALGSSEFTEDTPSRLEASAKIMAKYTTAHFVISGHTDSVGTQARNQKLSEKRAAAVKAFLVSKGAYEANLTTKGYGEKAHVDTNMTEAGRAKNRRVGIDLAN
jgi:outer membrane protein OmpA-like peptidoglycan-associated protein